MRMNLFQKLALGALISVLTLIFVGATVRVTGAGMGCPDWPTCWGLLIPPTSVEQVDFDKLPIQKFQRKAERMGRDPESITRESLAKEFNPRHVWTEFVNRLSSLPVGLFSLATFIAAFWQRSKRPHVFWLAFSGLFLVFLNAWMGARVVYSGLSPGVLTTHLALAMLLICVLTHCVWAGTDKPWKISTESSLRTARILVTLLLVAVVVEGIIGSQIRELTDEFAKSHLNSPRETWIGQLEESWLYLIHRSFSWAILGLTLLAFFYAKKYQPSGVTTSQIGVLAIVLIQMALGLIMAQVHIYSWVQVLHVGLAAILLAFTYRWLLTIPKQNASPAVREGADLVS